MSDSHRGDGGASDDFVKNRYLYYHALNHYLKNGFTFIELGDGDELWKYRKITSIMESHWDIYELIEGFATQNRLYVLFGNHDISKRSRMGEAASVRAFNGQERLDRLSGIKIMESLVLKYKNGGREIFLIHGHQVDPLNYQLWPLARFLVRYLWKPVQSIGFQDPTKPSENEKRRNIIASRLANWSKKQKTMLIAGHTHQSVYPDPADPLYLNDGCCVYAHAVTSIEITNGAISLVKWYISTRMDGSLYVKRELLDGPGNINQLYEMRE
jgi:UDP-2,3-diacylglucosamine pyrophosphatase LpxH